MFVRNEGVTDVVIPIDLFNKSVSQYGLYARTREEDQSIDYNMYKVNEKNPKPIEDFLAENYNTTFSIIGTGIPSEIIEKNYNINILKWEWTETGKEVAITFV